MNTRIRFLGVLLALFVGALVPALRAVDVEPFSLPVTFSFRISGYGSAIMTVYGEGSSPAVGHTTYSATTESDAQYAKLCPGKAYTANFQSSGINEYWLNLTPPSGYQFFVNGQPEDLVHVSTGGGGYSQDCSIELRPAQGESIMTSGAFSGIDLGQAVQWELGMGSSMGAHSIGRVGFREWDLSSSPVARGHLYYTPPINTGQVNVVRDGSSNQVIRQIASPHKVMDFVDVTDGYEVRYYDFDDCTWTGSVYTINSGKTPWKVIFVEAPPGTSNQLRITDTEGSLSRTSHLTLTSGSISSGTYAWQLQEGERVGTSSFTYIWLRTTTHSSTVSGSVRENVVTVRAGGTSGTIISETKYVYHTYAWGEDLYQIIVNPNGASGTTLATTYTYHETAPSSGYETYMGNYSRVKGITGPTGDWTAYDYFDEWDSRGQLKYQYQPYQDSPSSITLDATQGRVKYFEYAADPTGRYRRPSLVQEKINNVVTGKTVWTYDNSSNSGLARVKADVDTYGSGSVYQRTHREVIDLLAADVNESGEPYVVKNPDLSQTSWSRTVGDFTYSPNYTFTYNSGGQHWRVLKVNGSSSSAGAESVSSYDSQSFEAIYLIPYKSTIEVTVLWTTGRPVHTETRVYTGSGTWSAALNIVDSTYDTHNRLTGQTAGNGATTSYGYTNGYLSSQVGGDGMETDYTYDALGRTLTAKKVGVSLSGIHYAQADVTTTYDYDETDGTNYATRETTSAGSLTSIVTNRSYDRAGRLIKVTPPGLSATTTSYDSTYRTQTTTAPDGGTTIRETYLDGSVKSATGTAVVPQYYTYGVESDGRQSVQVNSGTSSSARLQKTWTDLRGRPIKLQKPGFSQSSQADYVEEQFYDATTGQEIKTTRTGAAPTLYVYDSLGRMIRSGLDVDNGSSSATTASAVASALVNASNDRVTETDVSFESYSSAWWLKSTTTTYPDAGYATHPITSYTRQRLSGFSSILGETQSTDAEGNTTVAVTSISGKLITTRTTVPGLTTDSYDYSYNGRASASTGHDGLTTQIQYDDLGRASISYDARGLTTTTAYYSGTALPHTVTDSASHVINTISYTTDGRTDWSQDAMGHNTHYTYNQRGQVIQQWGDGTYPVSYGYDATYADRTGMSTYRGASVSDATPTGTADTTTWTFDTASGLMWKKTDAAGKYVTTDYNQAGKVSHRTLARGLVTDYTYDGATGELTGLTYHDGTPSVTYAYTRSGQTDSVVDTTGTWDFVYDTAKPWRLSATGLPAYYGTRMQTMLYESGSGTMVGRYLGFQLGSTAGDYTDLEQRYAWSADGRFDTLTSKRSSNSVSRTFDYSYLADTPFVSGLTITGGHNFSVVRDYETDRNLLKSIDTLWSSTSVARYDYTHNALSQRLTAKQSGMAYSDYYVTGTGAYSAVFNNYTYNARNELETSAMYRGDTPTTTPSSSDELPGRRFEYRFDSIGNRKTDGPTGDANNVDDHYTVNALNQYTAKENNTVRFLGTAAASATVDVVGASAAGKKDHAWGADLVPANTSGAVAGTATVFAAVAGGGSGGGDLLKSATKDYFVPKAAQAFTYDDDGNLTSDSVFDYTYDAENRLVSLQHRSDVIGSSPLITSTNARKLVFVYDYQGRRVRKTTYGGWNGTTYSSTVLTDTKYLYDGWNLIAELSLVSSQWSVVRSYTWGLDLTGSLTASGGVGAMLQIYDSVAAKTLLPAYDGNGNVAALLNAETGSTLTLEAAYEYDPFGNLMRNEGAYAVLNNFRFSTKYTDAETGLVYYGHRFYSPSLGRFLNRDTISEQGGLNLYAYCGNNGVNGYDYLGMIFASNDVTPAAGARRFLADPDNVESFEGADFSGLASFLDSLPAHYVSDFKIRADREAAAAANGATSGSRDVVSIIAGVFSGGSSESGDLPHGEVKLAAINFLGVAETLGSNSVGAGKNRLYEPDDIAKVIYGETHGLRGDPNDLSRMQQALAHVLLNQNARLLSNRSYSRPDQYDPADVTIDETNQSAYNDVLIEVEAAIEDGDNDMTGGADQFRTEHRDRGTEPRYPTGPNGRLRNGEPRYPLIMNYGPFDDYSQKGKVQKTWVPIFKDRGFKP